MANATADAAKAAKLKKTLAKALRQKNNENTPKFFAAGVCGMIILFVIFHWTRFAYKKYVVRNGKPPGLKGPVAFTRVVRRVLIQKAPGFTTFGHALIAVGWLATCISIAFVNIDWSNLVGFSKRLGWVAIANLVLVTFLSLKNTPLAFLTTYSYERLNILHQTAGYGFVFWVMMHVIVYCTAWSRSHNLHEMLEKAQIMGIVAGISTLIMLASALFLRKVKYEVFYIIHVVFFMLIVIAVAMHRPKFAQHAVIATIFTGCIWAADRLLRLAKISYFCVGNSATLTPLPHGGTRIALRKSSSYAVAGSHAFVWIPKIRAAETHPFTIVSTNPLEFVVAAYDGFTRDLHSYARNHPGAVLKASIDGPYGNVPNFTDFTKVIFIAGGSGASFTAGVALDVVRKLGDSRKTSIEFIWSVRNQDHITWFSKELEELRASPIVSITIHSTVANHTPIPQSSFSFVAGDIEKTALPSEDVINSFASRESSDLDMEKTLPASKDASSSQFEIKTGRPAIEDIVRGIVDKSEKSDRIAVAACGPESMLLATRKVAAECIRVDGPSMELHLEQFGW